MGCLDGYLPVMVMIGLQFHYALLAIFTRAALLDGLTPTVFVVYRQGIATLALAPIIISSNKRRQSLKASLGLKSFSLMFITSLIGVTFNQNAYFSGLFYASSTAATAMSNLIPALTFVFAAILGYEKIDPRSLRNAAKILGTICCVSGALTMAFLKGNKLLHMEFFPDSRHLTASGDDTWILGCLLLLASSVFWSCWMIMQVPISSSCPDHILSTFWMCLFATIQSAIFALLKEQNLQSWSLNSSLQISCSLYAGIGIAVSFFIQSWCISERDPLYCAMFNPLATVITALVSATFLQEELYIGRYINYSMNLKKECLLIYETGEPGGSSCVIVYGLLTCIINFSLVGAIGVITGLYIVLWGKAKDFDGRKQELQQSNMVDDEISNKIDLEEPLLADKSEYVSESKMDP